MKYNTNAKARGSQDIRLGGRCHHPHTPRLCTKLMKSRLTEKITAKLETWTPYGRLQDKNDPLSLLKDVKAALYPYCNRN